MQVERANSLKRIKIPMGTKIKIRTKDFPKTWHTGTIVDVVPEEGLLYLDNWTLPVDQITELRRLDGTAVYRIGKGLSVLLRNIGIQVAFWGSVDAAFSEREQLETRDDRIDLLITYWGIGGISYGLGWLIDKALKPGNFKIGKRYRLQLIDLTVINPLQP